MRTHPIRVAPALLLAAALFSSPIANATSPAAGSRAKTRIPKGFLLKSLTVDGVERRYVVYVPAEYDGRRSWPTIVFLNGGGECGTDGLLQLSEGLGPAVLAHSEQWPFLIIFPQKPAASLQWLDMDAMTMAMLGAVKRDFKVDGDRLYLTGLSQGGEGTWRLGAKHAELWAAIAPICGSGSLNDVDRLKTLPIWAFHGEVDDVVPVEESRKMVKAIKEAGGDCMLTTYPNVSHDSWVNAYGQAGLGEWFLKHTRAKRERIGFRAPTQIKPR